MAWFDSERPLLAQLDEQGLEFDQMLRRALEVSASKPDIEPEDQGFPDSYLTLALYRLNTTLTRLVDLDEGRFNLFHEYKLAPRCDPSEVVPGGRLAGVLGEAAKIAAPGKTIGAGHFLRGVAAITRDLGEGEAYGFDDQVTHSTFSIETLMWGLGYHAWTPLADAPEVADLLAAVEGREPTEDIQYLMTLEEGRLVFRPTSTLDPYRIEHTPGIVRDSFAVLTHFKERYSALSPAEILELEDLINNPRAKEADLQKFFESHPHLFRQWDYRDVYPHVFLTREEAGPLIPDFVLVDPELQRSMIVDLKLPQAKVVRRQHNRDRFSAAITEARAQLLEYRDWFEESSNRDKLKNRLGMEIYRPRLGVVIGSSTDFRTAFERQKLASTVQDIDIVTYDDIVKNAQRRLSLVRAAIRG
ncbi:MAG: DUF4263 domain-containing protein [Deltaproteobacteria bacterium]|nr:DUF4263 domain-containing protein [Deltaproteobacteria bacterium]